MPSHAFPNPGANTHLVHPAHLDTAAPEDLRCPHCDYTVYGLPAPRCPECGQTFTWDQALAPSDVNSDLFEHRWRERPLGALLRTWGRAAFRPWKLWNTDNQRALPRVIPLVIFLVLQACVFARGWHTVALAVDPLMNTLGEWLTAGRTNAAGRLLRTTTFTYNSPLSAWFLWNVALWHAATFGVLLIFREMPRQTAPTWPRILRVYVHATALASLCMALWCVLEAAVDSAYFFMPPGQGVPRFVYRDLGDAMMWLCLLSAWACLWHGYRRHLNMPHGWAIAAVAMFSGSLVPRMIALFYY